jgi:glycosyltransferase involved in cell wall biosynthesis
MSSQHPFFSVVSPVYNRASTVGRAIESILKQTFVSWELLIIDDGSTDNTAEIVSNFTDPRIQYVYQENQERSTARNKAISMASGSYICFLDSDDYYLENHLATLASFLEQEQYPVGLIYTGGYKQRSEEVLVPNPAFETQKYSHPIDYILKHCLLINSVCVHKSVFQKHSFDSLHNNWEDTELWIRICAEFPFYFIPTYTTVAARETFVGKLVKEQVIRYHPRDWNWKLGMLKYRTLQLSPVMQALGKGYVGSYLADWFFEFSVSLLYANKYKEAAKAFNIAWKSRPAILISKKILSFGKAFLFSIKRNAFPSNLC